MTYKRLKSLVSLFLTGDNQLPNGKDADDKILSGLEAAYIQVATEADALKLFTTNKSDMILRQSTGNYFVRMPSLPETDEDELDIDSELGVPVARIMASYISKDKAGIHVNEASKSIRAYNGKVNAYMETMEAAGELDYEVAPETIEGDL